MSRSQKVVHIPGLGYRVQRPTATQKRQAFDAFKPLEGPPDAAAAHQKPDQHRMDDVSDVLDTAHLNKWRNEI